MNLSFNLSADAAGARRAEEALREQWGEAFAASPAARCSARRSGAVEQLVAFVDAGATDVNVALRAPWDEEALDAYLDEVVPAGAHRRRTS